MKEKSQFPKYTDNLKSAIFAVTRSSLDTPLNIKVLNWVQSGSQTKPCAQENRSHSATLCEAPCIFLPLKR